MAGDIARHDEGIAVEHVLFCRTTFSLLGPARPSAFSPSLFFFFLPLSEPPRTLLFALASSSSSFVRSRSSSARIASRNAGTVSQRASYPRRMFALRFCSDWMWLARFCEGESRAPFAPPFVCVTAGALELAGIGRGAAGVLLLAVRRGRVESASAVDVDVDG